ncbi:MAG: hypothetical protein H6Q30_3258, partial [Bacteroidetes bacterium]|nr:hypothetical protein [Bacteroidota bacterium]
MMSLKNSLPDIVLAVLLLAG